MAVNLAPTHAGNTSCAKGSSLRKSHGFRVERTWIDSFRKSDEYIAPFGDTSEKERVYIHYLWNLTFNPTATFLDPRRVSTQISKGWIILSRIDTALDIYNQSNTQISYLSVQDNIPAQTSTHIHADNYLYQKFCSSYRQRMANYNTTQRNIEPTYQLPMVGDNTFLGPGQWPASYQPSQYVDVVWQMPLRPSA